MDRDTLGVGSGGGGAVGPLLGVSTTLPLQQGIVEDNHYQIMNNKNLSRCGEVMQAPGDGERLGL